MRLETFGTVAAVVLLLFVSVPATAQEGAGDEAQAVRVLSESLVRAINARDGDALVALFLPEAEFVDDAGNTHRGREGIRGVFAEFVRAFPDAEMALEIDSIRLAAGELAIENGTRTVSTADADEDAVNRYTMVHVKRDGKWQIAVVREVPDDPTPTAGERLEALAWLVGDWIDEDAEVAIALSCRWDEGGSFLLADFEAKVQGETVMRSRQRIGWDPLREGVRSWVFDADGGFGEGHWTEIDNIWVVKSTAVLPDGTTGSATLFFEPVDDNRFLMKGFDRVLGNRVEPDFEATIVRRPPEPQK